MITEADRIIVERFKQLALERGISMLDVIVFGSRARGDADQGSDLDILVIVERSNREIREIIRLCAWEIGFDEGLFVQTVVMTKEEKENSPQRSSLLMLAVDREGIRM